MLAQLAWHRSEHSLVLLLCLAASGPSSTPVPVLYELHHAHTSCTCDSYTLSTFTPHKEMSIGLPLDVRC